MEIKNLNYKKILVISVMVFVVGLVFYKLFFSVKPASAPSFLEIKSDSTQNVSGFKGPMQPPYVKGPTSPMPSAPSRD